MKIVYDHQMFSRQEYGGVSRYFYEIASRVAVAEGYKANILSPVYFSAYLKLPDAPVTGLNIPVLARMGHACRMMNQLLMPPLMAMSKADLVHETCYSLRSIAPAGVPVVTTVHDMIHEKFSSSFAGRDTLSIRKRASVERAERVICVSENTKKDLLTLFDVVEEKVVVIPHGFRLASSQPGVDMGRPVEQPYLLYVGNRAGYKNFELLLHAYASSQQLKNDFVLVAFGGGAFTAEEQSMVAHLGLNEGQVLQLGGDDLMLASMYSHAEAFVYPSLYEGFGIPPLEAMSYNCPVVCSNTSSIPEVVGPAGAYFDPNSADSLLETLLALLYDPELRHSYIEKGRERLSGFSWEQSAQRTMDVYADLL